MILGNVISMVAIKLKHSTAAKMSFKFCTTKRISAKRQYEIIKMFNLCRNRRKTLCFSSTTCSNPISFKHLSWMEKSIAFKFETKLPVKLFRAIYTKLNLHLLKPNSIAVTLLPTYYINRQIVTDGIINWLFERFLYDIFKRLISPEGVEKLLKIFNY